MLPEENSNPSVICAAVRLDIESVRDGRASEAERAFVAAHIAHCAACASEWAFTKAAKSAWGQMPTAYPQATLSARIAAATYRKPTFAERFVASFAFLMPVPVRVAVGVAAVAGIALLMAPRQGALITQNPVALPETPKTTVAVVENEPAPAKPTRKAKPVQAVKPAPVVAVAKPAPKAVMPVAVAVKTAMPAKIVAFAVPATKPAPKQKPVALKKAAAQVALAVTKTVRVKPAVIAHPETSPVAPHSATPDLAPVETVPMVAAIEKPVTKEPTVSHATPVAGVTVGEREEVGDGYRSLGSQLSNAGRRSSRELLRGSAVVAQNSPALGIVNAPIK